MESRKLADIKTEEGKKERHLLYYDGETVSGKVSTVYFIPFSKVANILLFLNTKYLFDLRQIIIYMVKRTYFSVTYR